MQGKKRPGLKNHLKDAGFSRLQALSLILLEILWVCAQSLRPSPLLRLEPAVCGARGGGEGEPGTRMCVVHWVSSCLEQVLSTYLLGEKLRLVHWCWATRKSS